MRHNLLETLMGGLVLVIAGLFFLFAYSHTGFKNKEGITYIARFDRIDGLLEGSDVKMSGVKVGSISKLSLDPKTYMAVVAFTCTLPVPVDTAAEIVADGLMGPKFLALVPGGEEKTLPANGEIAHTQSSVSIESLIGKYMFNPDKK